MKTDAGGSKFAEIYRTNRHWLLKRALSKVQDRFAAEDIVHEAFRKTLEQPGADSIKDVRGYLAKAVDNCVIASYRKVGSRETVVEAVPECATEEKDTVVAAEDATILAEALKSLRPRQRQALSMFAQGLSIHMIADALGISSHNASALLLRAKANLKRAVLRRGWVPAFVEFNFRSSQARMSEYKTRAQGLVMYARFVDVLFASVLTVALVGGTQWGNTPPVVSPGRVESISASPSSLERPDILIGPGNNVHVLPRPPEGAQSQRVASIALPDRTLTVSHQDKSEQTPSYPEQLLDYLNDPSRISNPLNCGGLMSCPG